jgi:hypothetical protein
MTRKFGLLLAAGLTLASSAAFADADDRKWIAQCIRDNSDAKVSTTVVQKYCTCMNNKMDNNETRTITQWEKSHPQERKACERVAGWN